MERWNVGICRDVLVSKGVETPGATGSHPPPPRPAPNRNSTRALLIVVQNSTSFQ